jgi:GNAT superfamily N-acetyltransferase
MDAARAAAALAARSGAERTYVGVGTIEDVVVGFVVARLEGSTCSILGYFVTPAARGVGVGRAMLDAVVGFARGGGALRLDAPALPGDRLSKQLFEAAGLRARRLTMSRRLEGS